MSYFKYPFFALTGIFIVPLLAPVALHQYQLYKRLEQVNA